MPLRIGNLAGTTIDVDISFVILMALFVMSNSQHGMQDALLWAPVVLVSVLFHELAHAATIGAFGFGSSRIVLAGMGGVTINERRAKPWQDLLISLAGPVSSFILAAIAFYAVQHVAKGDGQNFLIKLGNANIFWGVLNLVPVSPLDGGHAVRHFLRLFLSEAVAFHVAIWLGIVTGVAIALVALRAEQIYVTVFMLYLAFRNFVAWQQVRSYRPPPPDDDVPDGPK